MSKALRGKVDFKKGEKAKMFPFVYCHYDKQSHRMRRDAKRCPRCGATVGRSDHPVTMDFILPNK